MEVHQTMLQVSSPVKERQNILSDIRKKVTTCNETSSTGKGAGSLFPFSHLNSNTGRDSVSKEWKMYTMFIRFLMTNRKMHVYGRRFHIAGRHIRIVRVFSCT